MRRLFSWLLGPQEPATEPPPNPFVVPPSGTYGVAVVGEASYQSAFEAICGPRSEEGVNRNVQAVLVHEDDNPHDIQAVRVTVDGRTVGYLSRTDARRYRAWLEFAGRAGYVTHCAAMIRGGWERGGERGRYGIYLDLPPLHD